MISTLNNMVHDANRSVLMASHLMDDVERVCENIILLHKGRWRLKGKSRTSRRSTEKSKFTYGARRRHWSSACSRRAQGSS